MANRFQANSQARRCPLGYEIPSWRASGCADSAKSARPDRAPGCRWQRQQSHIAWDYQALAPVPTGTTVITTAWAKPALAKAGGGDLTADPRA